METQNGTSVKSNNPAPTVEQINADRITQLANKYWAPHTTDSHLPFNPQIVEDIYVQEICASKFSIRRIMMLEFSQYLENFLWPNYNVSNATRAHTIISTEVPSTSEIIKGDNIDMCEEISTEEPWISEIIKEENIDVCEKIATEEPSTSTSSTIIIAETGNSVGFTKSMSITGGKRRHLVNTGSHEVSEKVLKIESDSNNEHMGALLQTSDKSTKAKVSSVDKSTCISPSMLFDSPGKHMLREHISQLKLKHALKLAALKAKIKRRDIKIMNLQTILQTLKNKNLLEEEEVHFLSGISEFNSE